MWGPSSVVPVFPNESLTNCRRHFASVGTHCAQSFDEELLETICRRFHDIESHPVVPGLFDAVFSPSDFRRALTQCVDSLWAWMGCRTLLVKLANGSAEFIQHCPLLERGSHAVEAWRCGSCLQTWRPTCRQLCLANFPRQLLLQMFEQLMHMRIGPHISPPTRRMPRWFSLERGRLGWVTCRCTDHLCAHICGVHRHPNRIRPLGSKAPWFACSMPVCQDQCGS